MKKPNAFTLIELLVVIAIIAILAAILFPVFAQAKLAAKKTVALSNAKNIATANMIYSGDYDDAIVKSFFGAPDVCAGGPAGWGNYTGWPLDWYSWRTAEYNYFGKTSGLLGDPTNPFSSASFAIDTSDPTFHPGVPALNTNFAANAAVVGFANSGCWNFSADQNPGLDNNSSLPEPASTILMVPSRTQYVTTKWMFGTTMGEAGKFNSLSNGPGSQVPDPSWCINGVCPATGNGPIHAVGKQVSFVWADGHAKAKPYAQTLRVNDPINDDWLASQQPNYDNTMGTQADRIFVSQHLFNEYK